MKNLLILLNTSSLLLLVLTFARGLGVEIFVNYSHIILALTSFIYFIFAEAFILFYLIGVGRMVENIKEKLAKGDLSDLVEEGQEVDLVLYRKKMVIFEQKIKNIKSRNVPWTILTLFLGSICFLSGGAFDTALIERTTHLGLGIGFGVSLLISYFWHTTGIIQADRLLSNLKEIFSLSRNSM